MFNLFFFFFQAEDGIRDRDVTGVQTCALPIFVVLVAANTKFVPTKYGVEKTGEPAVGTATNNMPGPCSRLLVFCAPEAGEPQVPRAAMVAPPSRDSPAIRLVPV